MKKTEAEDGTTHEVCFMSEAYLLSPDPPSSPPGGKDYSHLTEQDVEAQ